VAATLAAELLGQRGPDEVLQPHVIPHAELLEPARDAPRDARRQLNELLIGVVGRGFHAF